jgi:cytochrome c556
VRPVIVAVVLVAACGAIAPPAHAQTTALNRVMRQKLEHAQAILAAVVTSKWADLERNSRALAALTDDPAWMVMKTPEYTKQSEAFVRAANDLVEAAGRRDQEAVPLAYVTLTMRCVQCHRYTARARIASARP